MHLLISMSYMYGFRLGSKGFKHPLCLWGALQFCWSRNAKLELSRAGGRSAYLLSNIWKVAQ